MNPEKFTTDPSNNNIELVNDFEYKKTNIDEQTVLVPFWINNPNVLFQQEYITEFYPIETMTYEQKLNAITRTIIILTIVGFAFTQSFRLLLISLITICVIYVMYYYHELEKAKTENKKKVVSIKEGFEGPGYDFLQRNGIPIPNDVFQEPESHNPFSNVMMTDYDYNPNKKPAPPSFNQNINQKILSQAKQMVIDSNPGQPDIADKLFADLGEQLTFEQSLQPFYSNPGSTIPNDQGAFAEFCYGGMISCKEGNAFACARNLTHYNNY
jgi:hypothetical protein